MKKEDNEKDIVKFYSQLLFNMGFSLEQSHKMVKDIIGSIEEKIKKDGYDILPNNFGDLLLDKANTGFQIAHKIVNIAKKEGATDEDIKEYWNLTELDRRMMIWIDNLFRVACFLKEKDKALSDNDAADKVRKGFPVYGDPEDTTSLSGDDRLLPFELRDRVNRYMENHPLHEIEQELFNYNSFNAFVRDKIRRAKL